MNEIKSKYILRIITSYLQRRKLLQLIVSNKEFKHKLDITKEDYQLSSNFYIKKYKGISKIYRKETNELIFKGKYEKGMRISGKEYKNKKEYFIGEYKNNIKHIGKIFNKHKLKIFEGEFNQGLPWTGNFYDPFNWKITGKLNKGNGIVKEYNYNCFLVFTGEYKDGKKYSGIEYNINVKKIFEGEYKNNLRWKGDFYTPKQNLIFSIKEGNGNIEEYDTNGNLVYKGEIKYGRRFNGQGKEYYEENGNLKFEGIFKNFIYYEGTFYNFNGKITFQGKFNQENKLLYQKKDEFNYTLFYGQLKEEKKYIGIQISQTGAFIGEFDEQENYKEGKYYQGDFNIEEKKQLYEENKLFELSIKEIINKGKLKFEGKFKNNLFYEGKEYKYNQIVFKGNYSNGNYYNGEGYKIKDKYTGKMEGFEGTYSNGSKKGEETKYDEEGNLLMQINFKKYYSEYYYYDWDNVIYNRIKGWNCAYFIEIGTYIDPITKKKVVYKIFEGEYKDNKKYKGKEYYKSGNIKFEGKYINGEYYFGKEYYDNSDCDSCLKFEGEFKNGKYYKGKEYFEYNHNDEIHEHKVKFEGTYNDGKKYYGAEYNKEGGFIFVGDYKSGLYWNGYFYGKGELTKQIKTGQIIEGNGSNIELYNPHGQIEFKGEFKQGKYYEGEGNLEEKEFIIIKDICLNEPKDKEIVIVTKKKEKFKDGNLAMGFEKKEYIINGYIKYEKQFHGSCKQGKYYNGKELIYYKKICGKQGSVRLKRKYSNGINFQNKYYKKGENNKTFLI